MNERHITIKLNTCAYIGYNMVSFMAHPVKFYSQSYSLYNTVFFHLYTVTTAGLVSAVLLTTGSMSPVAAHYYPLQMQKGGTLIHSGSLKGAKGSLSLGLKRNSMPLSHPLSSLSVFSV